MAAGAILDLDDPDVGIEAQLARQPFLDLCLRSRLPGDARAEQPIGRARIVERGLRRRTEQLRGAVETVQLDENRAGLLGAAPRSAGGGARDVASAIPAAIREANAAGRHTGLVPIPEVRRLVVARTGATRAQFDEALLALERSFAVDLKIADDPRRADAAEGIHVPGRGLVYYALAR